MTFPYEEFDLSGVRTYPLESRQSKARVEDFARPVAPGATRRRVRSTRCRTCSRRRTSRPSSRAIVAAQRDGAASSGASARTSSRPGSAGADRPDGARLRVGDRDQRRRRSFTTSRSRSPARRPRTSTKRSARAVRDGGGDRPAAERRDQRRRRRAGWASARRSARFSRAQRSRRSRSSSVLAAAARLRHPGHGARRDRHRHHPHASRRRRARRSARAACATSAISSSNVARLERGVYLNCGSAVVLPEVFLKAVALARNRGIALDGLTTVNLDFVRLVPAADQRRHAADRRQRPRLLARRATTS